jgi:hypothetical protein
LSLQKDGNVNVNPFLKPSVASWDHPRNPPWSLAWFAWFAWFTWFTWFASSFCRFFSRFWRGCSSKPAGS